MARSARSTHVRVVERVGFGCEPAAKHSMTVKRFAAGLGIVSCAFHHVRACIFWSLRAKEKGMNYSPPGSTGQQRPEKKGRVGSILVALAAIVTILTFILTYVVHSHNQTQPTPPSPVPSSSGPGPYPQSIQQGWMNDCEGNNNSQAKCQCELSYFEQHASAQQFEQDYSAMPPGVVPPQLAGAAADCLNL
jgi:hypothetical protein